MKQSLAFTFWKRPFLGRGRCDHKSFQPLIRGIIKMLHMTWGEQMNAWWLWCFQENSSSLPSPQVINNDQSLPIQITTLPNAFHSAYKSHLPHRWQVNLDGLTGPINFNEYGKRKGVDLEILNLRNNSFKKVSSIGLPRRRFEFRSCATKRVSRVACESVRKCWRLWAQESEIVIK